MARRAPQRRPDIGVDSFHLPSLIARKINLFPLVPLPPMILLPRVKRPSFVLSKRGLPLIYHYSSVCHLRVPECLFFLNVLRDT